MKKRMKRLGCIILCLVMCLCFASCSKPTEEKVDLWENAIYTENHTFGEGEKTLTVEVEADGKSVEFIVNTNEEFLENALTAYGIISGQEGAYGMYVTEVNGIKADETGKESFWSLEKDGEQLTTGVSETGVKDGDSYRLVYKIL